LLRMACKTLKTAVSLNLHKPDDADVADEALRTLLLPKVEYVECLSIMTGHVVSVFPRRIYDKRLLRAHV
jgi:hypothetical protein